jgi:dTDP-4-dehydrorhamnose reductase
MNVIGTGLSGLVGSRVVELLSPAFSFENLSLETGVDITDTDAVFELVTASDAPWVFHFAAFTDVDACEPERILGRKGKPWLVNVEATAAIVAACRETGKRLLYISTDYVFDGSAGPYSEDDMPNPVGWYGITKYEGELLVAALEGSGLIVRIANPYRAPWPGKPDFVQKIVKRLEDGLSVSAPDDQIFVPTFIDDIAVAIDRLVNSDSAGVYHAVGTGPMSPYQAARMIAGEFGLDTGLVTPTGFAEYFANRAPRPLHAFLKNDKITGSGVYMRTFSEGLQAVRQPV